MFKQFEVTPVPLLIGVVIVFALFIGIRFGWIFGLDYVAYDQRNASKVVAVQKK